MLTIGMFNFAAACQSTQLVTIKKLGINARCEWFHDAIVLGLRE